MSQQEIIFKVFEYVILLFSLSLHEAAHAWMASRLGDQTARMLGRVTLNPAKHIDPIGTVLLPLAMLFVLPSGGLLVGWARPTPVNTRNFRKFVQGDVLTTLAGPASNLLAAVVAFFLLILLAKLSPLGGQLVHGLPGSIYDFESAPPGAVFPLVTLLYVGLTLNLILAAFNLIPLPPLDGSHLMRHLLPTRALRAYDQLGMISLFLMLLFGGRLIGIFVGPAMAVVNHVLVSL
ncbi:MAG TPA: site-2 protease family protein [Acidobacteriaceae bacterium]